MIVREPPDSDSDGGFNDFVRRRVAARETQEMITIFQCEDYDGPPIAAGVTIRKIVEKRVEVSREQLIALERNEADRRHHRVEQARDEFRVETMRNIVRQSMRRNRDSQFSFAAMPTFHIQPIDEVPRSSSFNCGATGDEPRKRNIWNRLTMRNRKRNKQLGVSWSEGALIEAVNDIKEMFQHPTGMPLDPDVMMEGYLYKRSSNAFKTWNRRWFQIRDNKLLYSHRSNDSEPPTVMEENLMLCLVRPAPSNIDRVGCFELVTPTRSHLLQADSESLCNDWMRALQRTILALHESDNAVVSCATPNTKVGSSSAVNSSVSSTPNGADANKSRSVSDPTTGTASTSNAANPTSASPPSSKTSTFEQIRRVPGNEVCADCGSSTPKWVSINLGVVLCIECSGVHRSLGVQISKVRSLTMDSIDNELRDVLLALGNRQVNAIYLKYLPEKDVIPPAANENSTRPVREAWIKAKYVERRFAVASDERARTTASSRIENLKHKTSNGGVNRSASYADMQEAEKCEPPNCDADPWSAELTIPQSTPSKRLSTCGSDTALDTVLAGNAESNVEWEQVAEACASGDLLALLTAHAQGFELNSIHHGTSALHIATRNGQTAAVEFLLLNGAKINMLDEKLNTPLHLAANEGNTLQVCQLLKRGADNNLSNVDGKTPLDIAMDGTHADIVTLFRVTIMRNEFNEYNNPMDETVDVVISDIARRAASEKQQKEKNAESVI
ncbi:unnamed protein product [Caenorhabditis bovis]|uniref:Uncharacterized protein n=1 Tax=Caenorhabditis bovis TaxID=2654633 RepID=A0A8S1FDF8_9PELO|nr:unnamed protein product [Caenorhabditis bovis]